MSTEIKFLILTKSARFHGNCVVGIDLDSKKLIRLVSDDEQIKKSISDENMICENGEIANPSDIVRIRIIKPVPVKYQPENVLLDCNYKWKKIRKANFNDVKPYISNDDYIFCNCREFLTESNINAAEKSIIIVKVKDINIYVKEKKYDNGEIKEKTKIDFTYNSKQYKNFSITDRNYFLKECNLNEALLVISIPSEPNSGFYNKFVAKVFLMKKN